MNDILQKTKEWALLLFWNKRMQSLYWRCGGMIAGGLLATVGELVTGANVPPEAKVFLGLLVGEITKYVSNRMQGK